MPNSGFNAYSHELEKKSIPCLRVLKEGTTFEKREMLACLKSKLVLVNKELKLVKLKKEASNKRMPHMRSTTLSCRFKTMYQTTLRQKMKRLASLPLASKNIFCQRAAKRISSS